MEPQAHGTTGPLSSSSVPAAGGQLIETVANQSEWVRNNTSYRNPQTDSPSRHVSAPLHDIIDLTTPSPPPERRPLGAEVNVGDHLDIPIDLTQHTPTPPLVPIVKSSEQVVPEPKDTVDSQSTKLVPVVNNMRFGGRRSASRVSNATAASRGNSPPPSSTKAAPIAKGKRTILDPETKDIKSRLQEYLNETKRDHVYIAKNSLAAARYDMNKLPVFQTDIDPERPGIIYDEESPFKDMGNIALDMSQAKTTGTRKLTAIHWPKLHTSSQHKIFLAAKSAGAPKDLPEVPKYRAYTTLKSNIVGENDENLRYYPYFGEDDEADSDKEARNLHLEDLYVDQTKKSTEINHRLENTILYAQFIDPFLEDLELSLSALTHYFVGDISKIRGGQGCSNTLKLRKENRPDDFDEEDFNTIELQERQNQKETSRAELEKSEVVSKVFKSVTGISLYEVVKLVSPEVKNATSPAKLATGAAPGTNSRQAKNDDKANEIALETGGNPVPYSLDSYTSLNCLSCYMHECPFHSHIISSQEEDSPRQNDNVYLSHAMNIPGWSYSSRTAVQEPWQEDKECSKKCFIKDRGAHKIMPGSWSEAQVELLRSSADVLRNNSRFACLLTSIINKPCTEIWNRIKLENLLPLATLSTRDDFGSLDSATPEPSKAIKRKKVTVSFLPGYPANCDKTHVHEERIAFQPCRHPGTCTSSCQCVLSHVTCEKSCACPPDCPRRWRGCSCAREGRPCSSENRCICIKAKRECDPDVCGTCGAAEALDRVNLYDEKYFKGYCNNIWIQRDRPKRTLLGRSAVSGMGLFMGEAVKKDDHVGEYKGELITGEEADRRGKIYDHKGISFLFNLNHSHVIDATRAGNKFRFVNHSSKRPNCQAKVLFVNGSHRIQLFARRELAAGEELFFDYGYNNKCVKFVQKEPPDMSTVLGVARSVHEIDSHAVVTAAGAIATDISAGPAAARRARKPRRLPAYLNGGKGSTERSRTLGQPAAADSTNKPGRKPGRPRSFGGGAHGGMSNSENSNDDSTYDYHPVPPPVIEESQEDEEEEDEEEGEDEEVSKPSTEPVSTTSSRVSGTLKRNLSNANTRSNTSYKKQKSSGGVARKIGLGNYGAGRAAYHRRRA